MALFEKTIRSGLAPNMTAAHVLTIWSYIVLPWRWFRMRRGPYSKKIEHELETLFGGIAVTCDSGRSALRLGLQTLGIGAGDDVLLGGYTCIVVSNAITSLGARPIYTDVDETLTVDVAKLEEKLTPKTKCLLVQHTFGVAANMGELVLFAKKHNLALLEDCAHTLESTYHGKRLGTFGDATIVSFGSEKVISCARGGALIVHNTQYTDATLALHTTLPQIPLGTVWQHIETFKLFPLGKMLSPLHLDRVLFWVARQLHLLPYIVSPDEKEGRMNAFSPARLPNILAHVAYLQLKKISINTQHRREIALVYEKKLPHLVRQERRGEVVPLFVASFFENPKKIVATLRKKRIFLSLDWTGSPIVPAAASLEGAVYTPGECPRAEELAQEVLLLPTHPSISIEDAMRIVHALEPYV